MGHNTHDDVARRWVSNILNPGRDALTSKNLLDWGDRIMSYGSHFEVARILRDRKGQPQAWLLNGNTYSVTTNRHQNAVRRAIGDGRGLPMVTIPHAVLGEASIDLASIQIIDVQPDWWTSKVVSEDHLIGKWEYDYPEAAPGDYGGWQNTLTHEYVARVNTPWDNSARPKTVCEHETTVPGPWYDPNACTPEQNKGYGGSRWNYEHEHATKKAHEEHVRAVHGVWKEVHPHRRQTGRKRAMLTRNTPWDLVDDPTAPLGYRFERVIHRHWLGGSLIRARVSYQAMVKHAGCQGTGIASEPWYITDHRTIGHGPLTQEVWELRDDAVARYQRDLDDWLAGGGSEQRAEWLRRMIWEHGHHWSIETAIKHTECRGCSGRGRVRKTRHRWAYFLSAFDENETRPSYFFCELPPKVHPTTVPEALECLKPEAVRLAEQAGREVKRQGDIFAIPMPGLTLRDLKAQGGQHEKHGNLLDTNHQATEVVRVGRQTYARGTLRHVPEFRRPDHRYVTIGREWSLIVKNTVPTAA